MKPLFQVGEEVILQSKHYPYLNGESKVLDVEYGPSLDGLTGELKISFIYKLTITGPAGDLWREGALRKKYKPSDESFENLKEELNLSKNKQMEQNND